MPGKLRKLSKNTAAMIAVTAAMIILNIVPWFSTAFADFYAEHIFSVISEIFPFAAGILPFSAGEILIAAGILLASAAPFLFSALIIRKKRKLIKGFAIFYGWVLIYILVTETMNCFILYHTTEFSEKYHGSAGADGFTLSELTDLCRKTIIAANELSAQVNRNEYGDMTVPENLAELGEKSMNLISNDYPLLSGSYPQPKKIRTSMLMTQLDLQGIYFPFTLEANYNSELCPARVPCTAMHEMSHLKGFIREDEACFIAYRACIVSECAEVRYSGYLSAMNYLLSSVSKYASNEEKSELYGLIEPQVYSDNKFVSEEFRKKVEEKAVVPTKTVSAISDKAMETTLKLNGVTDGKKSYSRMVNLLLEYHCCIESQQQE